MKVKSLMIALGLFLLVGLGACTHYEGHGYRHDSHHYGDFAAQRLGPPHGSRFLSHW